METNIQELGKDTNILILNQLDDRELVILCESNKFYQKICNNQMFWLNRILTKLNNQVPIEELRKYKGTKKDSDTKKLRDRTWSEYYIEDLSIIKPKKARKYLKRASVKGRLDQVIFSVLKGANIHDTDFMGEEHAVRLAVEFGHVAVVKYLVSQGANIRILNDYPLKVAAYNGHLEVVKYLVSLGADIHTSDNFAVKMAARNGHSNVVDYLVSLGAHL